MGLVKIAVGLAAATGVLGAMLYGKRQHEMKDARWFRNAAMRVAEHKGVNILIGHPPLTMGDVSRFPGNKYEPLEKVEPEPLYILEVPLEGTEGKGNMRLYLNYLVPKEVVRDDINAWNVGLIEVQVGKNKDDRFVIKYPMSFIYFTLPFSFLFFAPKFLDRKRKLMCYFLWPHCALRPKNYFVDIVHTLKFLIH